MQIKLYIEKKIVQEKTKYFSKLKCLTICNGRVQNELFIKMKLQKKKKKTF